MQKTWIIYHFGQTKSPKLKFNLKIGAQNGFRVFWNGQKGNIKAGLKAIKIDQQICFRSKNKSSILFLTDFHHPKWYMLSCLQLPLKQYHHYPFILTWISEFELQPQLWRWSQSPSWMLQVFPSGWDSHHPYHNPPPPLRTPSVWENQHRYPPPPFTDAVHLLSNPLKDPVSYRCRVILQTFLLWSHLQQIHVKES